MQNQEEHNTDDNTDDSRQLCRFWANGNCFKGKSCSFLHPHRSKIICKFYLDGNCKFGKVCLNMHTRPKPGEKFYISETFYPTTIDSQDDMSSVKYEILKKSNNIQIPSSSKSSSVYRVADIPSRNAWNVPLKITTPNDLEKLGAEINFNYEPAFIDPADVPLCPYYLHGYCMNDIFCRFIHGDICEMCQTQCLHPFNQEERKKHHQECLADHERAMEEAFAEARSREKTCGICFEKIVEKNMRFGVLEKCKHCFCLNCIRSWRKRCEQFEAKTIRSCPECRTVSDYIIPSTKWVEEQKEKEALVTEYHKNLKQMICKYTKGGSVDDCPFGNKCFYRHQNPDGSLAEAKSPDSLRRHRRHMLDLRREFIDDSPEHETILNEVITSLINSTSNRNSMNNDASRNFY